MMRLSRLEQGKIAVVQVQVKSLFGWNDFL